MHPKLDIKKAAPQAALQYSITTAPGFPVAHEGYRLVLLPLSPDTIHRPHCTGPRTAMIQYCNTNIIHENASIVKTIEAFHISYLKNIQLD